MMMYWARMAIWADFNASNVTAIVVMPPTRVKFQPGITRTTLSAKPNVYNATENAWAK